MKFLTPLAFASFAVLQMATSTVAAPPGVFHYVAVAGTSAACGAGGENFFAQGTGPPGVPCTTIADGTVTDFWADYQLINCTMNLFAEAGCPSDSLVLEIPGSPVAPGASGCMAVEPGFRALNVTCF